MAAGRKNFIFFLCLLDGVQFSTTFRYYCLMCAQPSSALTLTVYARLGLTLTVEKLLPANAPEECYMPHK